MDTKIVICGVRPGYIEEQVAEHLAPLLKLPAEQLLPALRSKQAISLNVKGSNALLRVARGLKENIEKYGCDCSLTSLDALPPEAPVCHGNFDHLNLRRFATHRGLLSNSDAPFNPIRHDGPVRVLADRAHWIVERRTTVRPSRE